MTGKMTMKYLTGVVVLAVLGLSAPLYAQDQSAQTRQTETKPPVKPAKKAEAPKKKKVTHADNTPTFDGTASTAEPKKSAPVRHSSVPPVIKEGGKTCSGKDEYRVCW